MNPRINTDEILQEIRANNLKLEGCVKPHDFSIRASEKLFCKMICSKCGGRIDGIYKIWYERGLMESRDIEKQRADGLAEPMDWTEITKAAQSISEVLPLLSSHDPLKVAATANAIMKTAANIRLTANLRGLNEFADRQIKPPPA